MTGEEWLIIQPLCFRAIKDVKQYLSYVASGMKLGSQLIKDVGTDVDIRETIGDVHKSVFKNVYPWAGTFRKPGQEAVHGGDGKIGASPEKIVPALEELRSETLGLLAKAKSEGHKVQALTAYHARFKLIHPFQDGNSRVGWLLSGNQRERNLAGATERTYSANEYNETLHIAQANNNLAPLADTLFGVQLPKALQASPYEMPLEYAYVADDKSLRPLADVLAKVQMGSESFDPLDEDEVATIKKFIATVSPEQRDDYVKLLLKAIDPPVVPSSTQHDELPKPETKPNIGPSL